MTSSHLSANFDQNSFYADKLSNLRRKIHNIQAKHEQSTNMTVVHEDKELDSARKKEDLAGNHERSLSRSRSALDRNVVHPIIESTNFQALEAQHSRRSSTEREPPMIKSYDEEAHLE